SGSIVGGVFMARANQFDNLGPFSGGTADIMITDDRPSGMTVIGAIDTSAGIFLTSTAGPLALNADVSAPGGTVHLVSAGAITQGAGVITAGELIGSSAGGARLGGAHNIQRLGDSGNQ